MDATHISENVDKNQVLRVISVLSQRIQELRESIVVKKRTLEELKAKFGSDWKSSKLAPSISYLQLKIIQSTSIVRSLLECVDDLGYITATINGTSRHYIHGSKTRVQMAEMDNHQCLKLFSDDVYGILNKESTSIVRQHTERWHQIRDDSLVTGSYWFGSLGLDSLLQQKKFYSKVLIVIKRKALMFFTIWEWNLMEWKCVDSKHEFLKWIVMSTNIYIV